VKAMKFNLICYEDQSNFILEKEYLSRSIFPSFLELRSKGCSSY
jgi:hypothetical protein